MNHPTTPDFGEDDFERIFSEIESLNAWLPDFEDTLYLEALVDISFPTPERLDYPRLETDFDFPPRLDQLNFPFPFVALDDLEGVFASEDYWREQIASTVNFPLTFVGEVTHVPDLNVAQAIIGVIEEELASELFENARSSFSKAGARNILSYIRYAHGIEYLRSEATRLYGSVQNIDAVADGIRNAIVLMIIQTIGVLSETFIEKRRFDTRIYATVEPTRQYEGRFL